MVSTNMWNAEVETISGGFARRYRLHRCGAALSYADALHDWRDDESFRRYILTLLKEAPFEAYRWETPPLTRTTVNRPFEFVLLDAPALARAADPQAFADQFSSAPRGSTVVTFPNLGNNAVLVAPLPGGPPAACVHLAAFVRGAPELQQHGLWRAVGAAAAARLGPKPFWLSTAGAGVAWLHVRLDNRPKYYGFQPYAQDDASA